MSPPLKPPRDPARPYGWARQQARLLEDNDDPGTGVGTKLSVWAAVVLGVLGVPLFVGIVLWPVWH